MGLPPYVPIRSVACGESHLLILTFDGEVYSSGSNLFGQLGRGHAEDGGVLKVDGLAQVRAISAGEAVSAAITESAPQSTRLFTWGSGAHGGLVLSEIRTKLKMN